MLKGNESLSSFKKLNHTWKKTEMKVSQVELAKRKSIGSAYSYEGFLCSTNAELVVLNILDILFEIRRAICKSYNKERWMFSPS